MGTLCLFVGIFLFYHAFSKRHVWPKLIAGKSLLCLAMIRNVGNPMSTTSTAIYNSPMLKNECSATRKRKGKHDRNMAQFVLPYNVASHDA